MKRIGCVVAAIVSTAALAAPLGQFAEHGDIGGPASPGEASYDAATHTYRITGFGRNMWADHDEFHYAWKRMSGDLVADTRLDFATPAPAPGAGGYLHRKGGIVLRQDLDADSVYVDALRMGNQQMSLQYRETKGGPTRLIWVNTPRQDAVRLVKIGDYAYLYVLGADGRLQPAGGSFKVRITGPYYVGLGVCPHDDKAKETMVFRDVHVSPAPRNTSKPRGETLQTINIGTVAEQTIIYHSLKPIVASGWSSDSRWVYFETGGAARRAVAWDSATMENTSSRTPPAPASSDPQPRQRVELGVSQRLSPDGKWIAYLTGTAGNAPAPGRDMALKIAPVVDGAPVAEKALTLVKLWANADSLPRATWSPDSKTIAFISRD
jgi:TolB protein